LKLPPSIIGATIIGLGTSLPELATTAQALKKGLAGLALGNLLGSCITNLTLVLGITAVLAASQVNLLAVQNLIFYDLLSTLSVWYMVSTSGVIKQREAAFLCAIYLLFVLQQIGVSIYIF